MERLDLKRMGLEIKIRRMQNRLTQREFAAFLGVSQTHLSNVEGGRVALGLTLLIKIKNRFGCTLDEIVDPDGYKKMMKKQNGFQKYKLVRCDE